jgi:hypothetical protein
MQKLNQALILLFFLIIGTSNLFASEKDVTDKVNQYLSALNQKETKTLDVYINNDANFTLFNNIVGAQEHLNKNDYIKFVEDGQVGVWTSNTEVKSVNEQGNLAVAYIESESKNLVRQEYLTLINTNGNWEIISSVSTLSKK